MSAPDAHVARAIIRVLGYPKRRQIGTRIFSRRPRRDGQFIQVDGRALVNDLLAWSALHNDRFDWLAETSNRPFVHGGRPRLALRGHRQRFPPPRHHSRDGATSPLGLAIS